MKIELVSDTVNVRLDFILIKHFKGAYTCIPSNIKDSLSSPREFFLFSHNLN